MTGKIPTYEELELRVKQLSEELKEQGIMCAKLQEELLTDPLTGLMNNRYFLERAEKEYQRAKREETPLAIVSLDIGNLGAINNASGGRLEGDNLLKATAGVLVEHTRFTDEKARTYRDGLKSARAGTTADEFMLVLPGMDYDGVSGVLSKPGFLPKLAGIFDKDLPPALSEQYRQLYSGVAMGAAVYIPGSNNYNGPEELIRASEHALYASKAERKRLGRNSSLWTIENPLEISCLL